MTNMGKYILSLLVVLIAVTASRGQQDAQYTQYMYNTMSINPAYTGTRQAMSIVALHRSQWVGLDGAPQTQTFNIHSPVGDRVGLGLSLVHDEIGPTSELYIDIDYSYRLKIDDDKRLSFGLKAGGHFLNVNFSKLNQYVSELMTVDNIKNRFSPNFGVGAYYYSPRSYLGISIPNMLETKHFNNESKSNVSTNYIAKENITYYLIGGYIFELSPLWKFKPATLVKVVSGSPIQWDISGNLMFNDQFIVGAAYRWSAAFSGMFGVQLSDNMLIGLAYDREITDLGNTRFNNGSVEFILRYDFIDKVSKVIAPRFF